MEERVFVFWRSLMASGFRPVIATAISVKILAGIPKGLECNHATTEML
jgi:hypothetical protein